MFSEITMYYYCIVAEYRMSTMDAIQWMLENESEREPEPTVPEMKPVVPHVNTVQKGASDESAADETNVCTMYYFIPNGAPS